MAIKNILYGASGHAKVVFEVAQSSGLAIHAIVDDKPSDFHTFF